MGCCGCGPSVPWVAGAVGSRCPAGDFRAMAILLMVGWRCPLAPVPSSPLRASRPNHAVVCATEIPILRIPTTLPTKWHQHGKIPSAAFLSWLLDSLCGCVTDWLFDCPAACCSTGRPLWPRLREYINHAAGNIS